MSRIKCSNHLNPSLTYRRCFNHHRGLLFLLVIYLTIERITTFKADVLFEAAFQGECRKSSPCQQLCFDLHDGTFECACNDGYHLDINGYSCLKSTHTNEKSTFMKLALNQSRTKSAVEVSPPEKQEIVDRGGDSMRALYSCNDIECEAGGVCIEDDSIKYKKVRCRCPLGRGGQFCEKLIKIKYPHFLGTSYLALPTLRNAHRSLQLSIEFKPESFDGVLLYSGQEPNLDGDFLSIVINQGFVEFRFDCGMGEGLIRSDLPVILNSWNTLNVYRDGRNAWMQLNQGQQIFGHSKGLFSRITFRLETFLGGSPNISQIRKRVHTNKGLVGCVRALQINDRNYDFNSDPIDGIDIDQCNSDACNHVTCLNGGHCAVITESNDKMCICPLGFTGEFCEIQTQFLIPSFNGTSHLQFVGFGEKGSIFCEILIVIKPNKPNGLFLYNGQKMDNTGDFISLNLVDGFVEFRFDLGSGAAAIRSPETITINEWHTIYASRTAREGMLKVDDQPIAMGMSLGAFNQLSLPLNLYIGGVPSLKDLHHNVQSNQLFSGCVQKVIVNGEQFSLIEDVLSGSNIENCQHPCNEKPCYNNGICDPLNHDYRCYCMTNFIGEHCEEETGSSTMFPMFYGNSFLQYSDQNLINRIRGFKTIIHLNMRAFSSNGLILWFGETYRKSKDYLAIGLKNGHLNINWNLGSGDHQLAFNITRIDDGQWHEIDIIRYGKQIFVRIDHSVAIRGTIPGDKSQLDIDNSLYLGGLEDTALTTNKLYNKGFIGCISNMTVDENYYLDMVAQSDRGINIRTCI